ncbi:fimbrial protein [Proteus mirabilis]
MILQRLSLSTAIFAAVIAMANADPNMRFHGELIDEPCVIKPGDEIIVITLDKVTDSAFYNGVERTKSQQFEKSIYRSAISL